MAAPVAATAAAAAVAAAAPVDPLIDVRAIFTACKLNATRTAGMINAHDIESMDDFQLMRPEDAYKFLKTYNDTVRSVANKIGLPAQKRLEGFLYWYHDQHKRGITPNATDFTNQAVIEAVQAYAADKASKDMQPTDIDPGKIEIDLKWWDWKDSFYNMTKLTNGVDGDPLYYVIRPDREPGWVPPNDLEARAEQLPHTGVNFKKDSDILWTRLIKCTNGTLAQEWLKDYEQDKNTRAAWKRLLLKCEGKEANNKRVVSATRIVSTDPARGGAFYTNEYNFSFDKYSTKLQQAYRVLKISGMDTPSNLRVQRLLDGITVQGKPFELTIGMDYVSNNYLDDWDAAVSHMSTKIAKVFPARYSAGTKRKDFSGRRISEANRGRGRGRGRFDGRGGRGRGGRGGRGSPPRHEPDNGWFHGVDCNNPSRKLSQADYNKIGSAGRAYLFEARQKNRTRNVEELNTDQDDSTDQTRVKTEPGTSTGTEKGGTAGKGFGRGAYNK